MAWEGGGDGGAGRVGGWVSGFCMSLPPHSPAPWRIPGSLQFTKSTKLKAMLQSQPLRRTTAAAAARTTSTRALLAPVLTRAPGRGQVVLAAARRAPIIISTHGSTTRRRAVVRSAGSNGDAVPVPAAALRRPASAEALRVDAEAIGDAVAQWLDEEWAPLPEHRALGRAVSDTYVRLRSEGGDDADDVASVLLGLAGSLTASFDFGPTFTGAFDVANKVIEIAMQRDGMEVCDCGGGGGGGGGEGGGGV